MKSEAYLKDLSQRISTQSKFAELSLLCEDIFTKIFKKNAERIVLDQDQELSTKEECNQFKEFLKKNGEDGRLDDIEIYRIAYQVVEIKLMRAA